MSSAISTLWQRYTPYYKQLIELGVPIMIGQLGIIVVGFADNIMVGQHSVAELSAASFVNNLFNLVFIFALGFSYGLTPIVGAQEAQGDRAGAGRSLRYSLIAHIALVLLLSLLMVLLYSQIPHMGQPAELLPLILPYFLLQLSSLLFVLPFNALKQFFDGTMDTRTPMYILLASNLLNIVGNYLLIFGKCGLPEMGLMGAGVSTLLSRIFLCLTSFAILLKRRKYAPYRVGLLQWSIDWRAFRQLVAVGFPIACQMGMECGAFSLSVVMMGWVGSSALAAHQIMGTFTTIGFMLYYGIGASITILASNKRGSGDRGAVSQVAHAGYHLILLLSVVVTLVLYLLRNHIGLLFTSSQEVNHLVALLVIPTMIYQLGDGLQIAFANALRAMEDVTSMAIIAFVCYFLVCLPAAYLFGIVLNGGAQGVWWGFPLGLTLAGVLFYLRFRWVMQHK